MIIDVDEVYCMKCGKKYGDVDDDFTCECGCRTVVLGSNHIRTENGITCTCGNEEFKLAMHLNCTTYAKYVYKCDKCNNSISMDTFRESYY